MVSRTSQFLIYVASIGDAIVRSIIEHPFLFWNVGFCPVLHIVRPRALIRSDSASPLLLQTLDPQSVWWALKSPVSRTSECVELMLSSNLAKKSIYSLCVVFGEQ